MLAGNGGKDERIGGTLTYQQFVSDCQEIADRSTSFKVLEKVGKFFLSHKRSFIRDPRTDHSRTNHSRDKLHGEGIYMESSLLDQYGLEPLQTDENSLEPLQTDENSLEPLQTDENSREPLQTDENTLEPLQTDENSLETFETDENSLEPLQTDENSLEPLLNEVITGEYEVQYNEAYMVPVLYARFYTDMGTIFTPEQVFQILGVSSKTYGVQDISISPHPLDDTPWIQVHPCRTNAVIADLLCKSQARRNYIVAFLSFYGQALGLNIDPRLAKDST